MNDAIFDAESAQARKYETSRDGIRWDPREDYWTIAAPGYVYRFSFHNIIAISDELIAESSKSLIANYIKNMSTSHSFLLFYLLCKLIKHTSKSGRVNSITAQGILSYRASLTPRTEWHLGTLRGLLETWNSLGLPGLATDVMPLLRAMQLKGNVKGEAVRTADPLKGAFTDIEFQAITGALNDRFVIGDVPVSDYLLVWLFLALGCRPVQLALLKALDFAVTQSSDGSVVYHLKVPRVKQRGVAFRTEFKNRKLIPEIGRLLATFIAAERERWSDLGLTDSDMPIFSNIRNTLAVPGLEYHCTTKELARRVDSVFSMLDVRSERTGQTITVNPRRFRYTRGTNAAREGASELVIAEILDHSDTQNVGVYVEAVPEIIERIDRAMAVYLAPMAQACQTASWRKCPSVTVLRSRRCRQGRQTDPPARCEAAPIVVAGGGVP